SFSFPFRSDGWTGRGNRRYLQEAGRPRGYDHARDTCEASALSRWHLEGLLVRAFDSVVGDSRHVAERTEGANRPGMLWVRRDPQDPQNTRPAIPAGRRFTSTRSIRVTLKRLSALRLITRTGRGDLPFSDIARRKLCPEHLNRSREGEND